jgi:hypothetical protein
MPSPPFIVVRMPLLLGPIAPPENNNSRVAGAQLDFRPINNKDGKGYS